MKWFIRFILETFGYDYEKKFLKILTEDRDVGRLKKYGLTYYLISEMLQDCKTKRYIKKDPEGLFRVTKKGMKRIKFGKYMRKVR